MEVQIHHNPEDAQHIEGHLFDPSSLSPYATSTSSPSSSLSPGTSAVTGMMYPDYSEWHMSGLDPHQQAEIQQYQYLSSYPQSSQAELMTSGAYWQTDIQMHPGLTNNIYQSADRIPYSAEYSHIQTPLTTQSPSSSSTGTTKNGKPKRKRVQSLTQRKAANIRERRRMFHLNEAFDQLRKRLPAFNYEKRLSRIETLRLAMTYISFMHDISKGEDPKEIKLQTFSSPLDSQLYGEPLENSDDSVREDL